MTPAVLSLCLLLAVGCQNLNVSTFRVIYHVDHSTAGTVPIDTRRYYAGEKAVVLGNTGGLEFDGSTFSGWNTDPFGRGDEYGENDVVVLLDSDVNLYADRTPDDESLIFNGNGVNGYMDPLSIPEGNSQTLTSNGFVATEYTFIGWNTVPDGSGTSYDDCDVITMGVSGVVLYAQWGLTVSFDANGGIGSMDDLVVPLGSPRDLLANEFTKSGSTYLCWNTEPDGSGIAMREDQAFEAGREWREDTVFYAQWIADDAPAFVTVWDTRDIGRSVPNPNVVNLPMGLSGDYAFVVDWGDGAKDSILSSRGGHYYHLYDEAGRYTISIRGEFAGFRFYDSSDRHQLVEISSWGPFEFRHGSSFSGARNLRITASEPLDLTGTYQLGGLFKDCEQLTEVPGIEDWIMPDVWDMSEMFRGAVLFDQDLSGMDVSNVRNMSMMFNRASSFNQDLSAWDTSNVETMYSMFRGAASFDQDLGEWDIRSVTDMAYMLEDAELSTSNYDATLRGWWSQVPNIRQNVEFHGGASNYSGFGEPARSNLINIAGWTITDGGNP